MQIHGGGMLNRAKRVGKVYTGAAKLGLKAAKFGVRKLKESQDMTKGGTYKVQRVGNQLIRTKIKK